MKNLLFIPFLFVCSMVIGQSSKIIGKPYKLTKFEVAQNDFPMMNWDDAKKACANLGSGWRLPTKDELNLMYKNRKKIGGFANNYYWSSTEYLNRFAWRQNLSAGRQDYLDKYYGISVRAVRSL